MKSILAFASSLMLSAATCAAFAMGPDPGGHTGATVTPETTKTDRPAVDAARQSTSGSKTETNATSSGSSLQQAQKK